MDKYQRSMERNGNNTSYAKNNVKYQENNMHYSPNNMGYQENNRRYSRNNMSCSEDKLCHQEEAQGFKDKNIGLIGFSSRGESHKKSNLPGQDANCIKVVKKGDHDIVIATISDGVGSAALSHYGSSIASKTATNYLANFFEMNTSDTKSMEDKEIGDKIREAMRNACDAVKKEAEAQHQPESSYYSTLTTAIYDGDNLYFGHIGDDGIVALTKQGELLLVTKRHKGEEASSVYPLQAGEHKWQVEKVNSEVDGFVMATDGLLDAFVRDEREENRVYYPIIEPALNGKAKTESDFKELASGYLDYMSSSECHEKVTDDITFVTCVNTDRIMENSYTFDDKEWDRDSKMYEAKRKKALYGQSSNLGTGNKPQISIGQIAKVTSDVNPEDKLSLKDRVKKFFFGKNNKEVTHGGKND